MTENRNIHFLFDGILKHAHSSVQQVYKEVLNLEQKWEEALQNNGSRVLHVKKLVGIIGSLNGFDKLHTERRNEIFRYFCTASIYAKSILISSIKNSELNVSSTKLTKLDEEARNIIQDLFDVSFPESKKQKVLNPEQIEDYFIMEGKSGRLARCDKLRHIPCLLVPINDNLEVGIRQGFELKRENRSRSRTVRNTEDTLTLCPVRVHANDELQFRYPRHDELRNILRNREDHIELLRKKHITSIYKEYSLYDENFASYIIDVADDYICGKTNPCDDSKQILAEIAGERRTLTKNCSCNQEDVLITYFANELFGPYTRSKEAFNRLEAWSRKSLVNYVCESDSEMYVGFDFGTIQDAQYFNKEYVSGSTNILLLALTRGFMKLYENLHTSVHNLKNENGYKKHCVLDLINELKPVRASRRRVTANEIEEPLFIEANRSGILINVRRYPPRLWMLAIFYLLLYIFFGVMLVLYERESVNKEFDKHPIRFYGYMRMIGSLIELWSAFAAFFFISEYDLITAEKCLVNSLSALISALKHDRHRAIHLLAKLKNPRAIFSGYNSSAFTETGQGEFEIDDKILVRDLQGCDEDKYIKDYCSNYIFGVNYSGEPVMADANGNVRKLEYPSEYEPYILRAAGSHEFGLRCIMELPTRNLHLGSSLEPGNNLRKWFPKQYVHCRSTAMPKTK